MVNGLNRELRAHHQNCRPPCSAGVPGSLRAVPRIPHMLLAQQGALLKQWRAAASRLDQRAAGGRAYVHRCRGRGAAQVLLLAIRPAEAQVWAGQERGAQQLQLPPVPAAAAGSEAPEGQGLKCGASGCRQASSTCAKWCLCPHAQYALTGAMQPAASPVCSRSAHALPT